MENIKLNASVITQTGAYIRTQITMPEDFTMNQLVSYLRIKGIRQFKLDTMRCFANVPEVRE